MFKKIPIKKLGIVWTVLVNVLILITVLALLDTNNVTIPLLIFVYASLNSAFIFFARSQAVSMLINQRQNAQIIKLLGDDSAAEDLEVEVAEAEDKIKQSTTKFWINSIGTTVVWWMSVIGILSSINL